MIHRMVWSVLLSYLSPCDECTRHLIVVDVNFPDRPWWEVFSPVLTSCVCTLLCNMSTQGSACFIDECWLILSIAPLSAFIFGFIYTNSESLFQWSCFPLNILLIFLSFHLFYLIMRYLGCLLVQRHPLAHCIVPEYGDRVLHRFSCI